MKRFGGLNGTLVHCCNRCRDVAGPRCPVGLVRVAILLLILWLSACSIQAPRPDGPNSGEGQSEPVLVALAMIGTPYRFGGQTLAGFDCSGLSSYVFEQSMGIQLPRTASAQSEWPGRRLARNQLRPGDLVFFETHGQGISHVGVYAGQDRFIHAPSAGSRVRLQAIADPYWLPRFRFGKRILAQSRAR